MSLTLQAPAKLNLSLRILRRRDDGFHEIDTWIVKLPCLADSVSFHPAERFSFHCETPGVPADGSNLVVRAVRAYEAAAGISCKFAILLTKRIPHGAGLGGGSSDAATTLLGLNELHKNRLDAAELHALAADLGSDIPCFLAAGATRCTGRGETVTPAAAPPPLRVLLLKPSFEVATPDAYQRWRDSQEIPGIPYAPQQVGDAELVNDLERPVFWKHRFLAEMKLWLLARPGVTAAMLSGSGSTVFAVLDESANAEKLASLARAELDPTLWHWSGRTGI